MPSALLCTAVVGIGVLSNLPSFLFKEPSSVQQGCQRQLVNEGPGPLVTECAVNLGREGATPAQPADMAAPSPDDRFHHCTYDPVANEFDSWGHKIGGPL